MRKKILVEAPVKQEFTSRREAALKKRLIDLLKDDGKGHKHAKYAKRLEDFDINIVPKNSREAAGLTAAMDFENGKIYINEGFIDNESTFFQLNVLIRHEMAHALLMHQIRMMHKITDKYGDKGYTRIRMSQSLHRLQNIIADYEISNTRYTADDKTVVRNMMLNGQLISGLVTEDHRGNWTKMSVEEMYDALNQEISEIQNNLLATNYSAIDPKDFITNNILSGYDQYNKIDTVSTFDRPIADFMKTSEFKNMVPEIQELIKDIYDEYATGYTKTDLQKIMAEIATTSPIDTMDLTSASNGNVVATLYTPEEKYLAIEILKTFAGQVSWKNDYDKWYDDVVRVLSDSAFDDIDIKDILNNL